MDGRLIFLHLNNSVINEVVTEKAKSGRLLDVPVQGSRWVWEANPSDHFKDNTES